MVLFLINNVKDKIYWLQMIYWFKINSTYKSKSLWQTIIIQIVWNCVFILKLFKMPSYRISFKYAINQLKIQFVINAPTYMYVINITSLID